MDVKQAIEWRLSFAQYLSEPDNDWWVDEALQMGGMLSTHEQLQQLVQQHGVAATRSSQCAEELIRSLGQSTIIGILKSPRPWADLKARANLHSPPIRVVLASELQEAIKSRVQQGAVGSKQTKSKKKPEQPEVFQLQAKQIAIPHAVFKQEDGNELSQIQPSQINGNCRGVLVVNTSEALPYCQLSQPVSKGGVAILVPDHDDPRLPDQKEIIRVPAQCVATKEPVIATMAMIQIGSQMVNRNTPQQCIEIEEVANEVVRVAIYRDQFPDDWESFVTSPVKHLLALPSIVALDNNCILDVWDRQFLNLRLSKESPKDASVFMVNLRLHKDQAKVLLAANAQGGLYAEPRTTTGRQPSDAHQVIWLPKKNFAEAQVSNQMTQVPSSLVRSGNRYGLRVLTKDAEAVHLAHRPDVTYLDGTELRKYRIGPLPYGSTKQSIVNAFKKWGWTARPLGPQGQSQDKSGTMWLVQAAEPPTHWVFQMQHGDVLVSTDVTTEAQHHQVSQPSVIASSKTLQSLKKDASQSTNSQVSEAKEKQDPWTHRDPWQAYNTREMSVGQVASMQAQLEAKIDQRLKESLPSSEDCSMHEDSEARISSLEAQVQQLTGNFQSFQQQQIQHNHGMYNQLQTLDKQMHEQHQSLTNVLDNKLEDQMMRIEALLTKRSRTEWLDSRGHRHPKSYKQGAKTTNFVRPCRSVNLVSWLAFCIFAFFARIGEATNPGPNQTCGLVIGCINPNGLLGKGSTINQLPKATGETIWAVSETHLTRPGRTKMAVEFKARHTGYNLQLGAEVPLKSNTVSAVGGKQIGVGFLSTAPCRALTQTWSSDQWKGCRVHASCFQVNNRWVQGGVVYGIAAQTSESKCKTNQLCCLLEERIINQSQGLRFIAGDFNQGHGNLESVNRWMEKGWVNAQVWAQQKLGKPILPTCHGKTTKDHLYLSPELALYLEDVHVDSTFFADHSCLWGQFRDLGKPPQVPLWRQPAKIDWAMVHKKSEAPHPSSGAQLLEHLPTNCQAETPPNDHPNQFFEMKRHLEKKNFQTGNDTEVPIDMSNEYEDIANQFELETQQLLAARQIELQPNQLGRCKTREVRWTQEHSAPPRHGRYGDAQPEFHGLDLKHSQWLRQLRRCENLVATLKQPDAWDSYKAVQRDRVWQSMIKASGFNKPFRQWWKELNQAELPNLPGPPPTYHHATIILRELNKHFRHMESNLLKSRIAAAKNRRENDVNYIFKDLKEDPPQPVQMLVSDLTSKVVEIDLEDNAVVIDPPRQWDPEKAIVIGSKKVDIIYAENDKLWVDDLTDIQLGQDVKQDSYVGELCDLFKQFGEAWMTRWDRHLHVEDERWEPVISLAKNVLPQPPPMTYQPISYDEWVSALKHKKKHSAVGPDGMAKLDLLNMSRHITERLLKMLADVEAGSHWPIQAVTGFVMALEKTPGATSVDQYRPITVFSLVFRTWGSIRARQVLRHLATIAPSSCVGNLPGKQTSEVWQSIQAMIEESLYTHTNVSGAVVDIVKAFNLLPRLPILTVMHHLNVAPQILRGWSNALINLRRRFKIRNAIGPALSSVTGFAEGDAMSVTAMLGANLVCHAWFRLRYPSVHMWSFVDNLEIVSQSGEDAIEGLEGLKRFAAMMDVQIDDRKTYGWSTVSHHRGVIRQSSVEVKYWARDLGGHMQYGQQVTNQTVASRCAATGPLWNKLARSLASYSQKLRACRAKAWPRCLHAVQSVHLADEHFDRLRTGAMQGIGSSKNGTSPMAHPSLVEDPKNDPQYYSIFSTVMQFRQIMHPDQAAFVFSQIALDDRQRPRPGPCSVLINRLHQIAWHWETHTTFKDQMGLRCDIFESSPQELSFRLEQAWQDRVRAIVGSRKSMQGLHFT